MRRLLLAVLLLPLLAPVARASDCRAPGHFEPPDLLPPRVVPACRLAQPGMAVYVDANKYPFTMSPLLRGSDGRGYFVLTGTALRTGDDPPFHRPFERRYPPGKEPVVRDDWGRPIGRVLYAYTAASGFRGFPTEDYAYVRVDRGVAVTREIRGIGVPTRLVTELDAVPRDVVMYGQGPAWGQDHWREGLLPYGLDGRAVVYSTMWGSSFDAGAPVTTRDRAVVGYHNGGWWKLPQPEPEAQPRAGAPVYRLGPVLASAPRTIGVRLTLDLPR